MICSVTPPIFDALVRVAPFVDRRQREQPQLLDNVNPTFTWVRLAQRIPAGIRLTDIPADVLVTAGMTCTVVLPDGAHPQIGASAKRLFAAVLDWFKDEAGASAQTPTQKTASRGPYRKAVREVSPALCK